MNISKIPITFFFFFTAVNCLTGQTLLGIKTGINWTNYRDIQSEETYFGYSSYGFGIDIKGRKTKPVHFGASIEFYRNSFNWDAPDYPVGLGNQTFSGRNVHYYIEWLRLSLFPEFCFGKRFQFNFSISPYISFKVHSSKNGTSWTTDSHNHTTTRVETGSANGDFTNLDIGFKENVGFGFAVLPYLVLSLEENYGLGISTVNKVSNGFLKTKSFCIFFCTSFIIPAGKSEEKKSDDPHHQKSVLNQN